MSDEDGVVALHWACYFGNLEMMTCLLEHGADQNAADKTGCRPICLTCKHGHIQATRLLLHSNADLHTLDMTNRTCLMLAASRGHLDIVRLLLLYGADPVLEDVSHLSALDHARVGRHGLALDAILQVCVPQTVSCEHSRERSSVRAKSFRHPVRNQDVDPGYSDSWEAHQSDLFLRLNQEIVSDIFQRLIDFKEKGASSCTLESSHEVAGNENAAKRKSPQSGHASRMVTGDAVAEFVLRLTDTRHRRCSS